MCVLAAVSGQDVRAADCNPFVKKGQSPFLTVSKLPHPRELFVHLTVKKSHGRTCCLFSYQRQHRTIASASLRRLFAPLLQFEKPEIHTGFLRFPNFELGQKSCLRLLAELRGAALNKYKIKALSLYIAQVKRKLGLNLRECYNKPWSAKSRPAPQVSPEKEVAILDALRHFNVIE